MTKVLLGHDGHTLVYGVLPTHEHNRAGHDLADWGFFGRMTHEDYFARVVTLRHDTDQSLVGNDQQGANTVLRHLFNRFVDRLFGSYRQDSVLVFALQNQSNRVGKFHRASLPMITRWFPNATPVLPCRRGAKACPRPSPVLEPRQT